MNPSGLEILKESFSSFSDDSKIGQKMIEKMGWEKGKGLGAKEQGNVDIIRVNYKDDSKGIGYKGTDDQWIAHQVCHIKFS